MGGQFQELLLDVARKLEGAERMLQALGRGHEELGRQLADIRDRLSRIEQDAQWLADQRRRVDGRLETGDHTFLKLQTQVNTLHSRVSVLVANLQKRERETDHRDKVHWKKEFVKALIPMLAGLVWQLLYHLFVIGPRIAEAMKHGGTP